MGVKDKPAGEAIGDDKGEGGQQDIRTDRVETSVAGQPFVQEPPAERPEPGTAAAEAAADQPTGESREEESTLAGNPRPRSERQQGDEDLDADREPGQGMK